MFETQSKYTIIENKTLEQLCSEENINKEELPIKSEDLLSEWTNYCWIISKKNNLNIIYNGTFTYYVTLFMTGLGQSCNAEEYFKKSLEKNMMKLYDQVRLEIYTETEQKKELFKRILTYFTSNKIKNDERAMFGHYVKLNQSNYDLLKNMEAKQWNEKVIMALHKSSCDKKVENNATVKTLQFNLTWSQEQEFDKVTGNGATTKLLYILGGLHD